YHTEIMALENVRVLKLFLIYLLHHPQSMVTQIKSNPTFLAHRMVNVRHRRQDRGPVDSTIPKSRLITREPSEDFVKTSHVVNTPVHTMHIMGDLGPPGNLCIYYTALYVITLKYIPIQELKTDGNEVVTIKPDFNKGKEPYRPVETKREKRGVWRLTLQNVSEGIRPEETDRQQCIQWGKKVFDPLLIL
uniref:Uncharacterized protein n=1 Tax=Hucho hucho TaxID=62062 RepID=A0A4W5JU79_9TELE